MSARRRKQPCRCRCQCMRARSDLHDHALVVCARPAQRLPSHRRRRLDCLSVVGRDVIAVRVQQDDGGRARRRHLHAKHTCVRGSVSLLMACCQACGAPPTFCRCEDRNTEPLRVCTCRCRPRSLQMAAAAARQTHMAVGWATAVNAFAPPCSHAALDDLLHTGVHRQLVFIC